MSYLKLKLVVVVLFSCSFGFSTVRICGNHTYPDGHTSRVCVYFYAKETKCDNADMLAVVSQPGGFTGGWTCQSDNFGIASANGGDASLIRTPDGKAYLKANGETSEVGSDAFSEYVRKVRRETANMRVNTQAIQSGMDTFLDSDNGFVSDAKLQKLSAELGVPIVVSRGWNPKDEPGYHQSKWSGKAAQPASSGTPGSRQTVKIPADTCSLPDCSCRVVSASGDSLCEGGQEGETAAGVHFCKCGKFGPSAVQSGGAGGEFTLDKSGAIAQYDHEAGGMNPVAKPATPKPRPTSGIVEGNLQAQRQPAPAPEKQGSGGGETCIAEYETASDVEAFFREDRRITGVWKAKSGPRTPFQKPGVIVADANGCLYGCTGNVWEPLDCPGRDFSSPGTYPGEFTMGAACSSTNMSGLSWRRVNVGRGGVDEVPPSTTPMSRFVLVSQQGRPPQADAPGDGSRRPIVKCWFYTKEGGWLPRLKCCIHRFKPLPTDHNTMQTMDEEDCSLDMRTQAPPDVQDGSIVLRTADGRDFCLNPNGSFGACASDFGIKEKGIR